MATLLRKIYEVSKCFDTDTHATMCKHLWRKLITGTRPEHNLAVYFAKALEANKGFCQIDQPFITDAGRGEKSTNPVAQVMKKASPLCVTLPDGSLYEFTFLQREVPPLRTTTKAEQREIGIGWIDYAARTTTKPILGEIKWGSDKNPFYAFVQLLTYLSEIATPNQIKRAIQHTLFGSDMTSIAAFDLHIFLANFNDEGLKGALVEATRQLASAFKARLKNDHPETAKCVGGVLCLSAQLDNGSDHFSEIRCLWIE